MRFTKILALLLASIVMLTACSGQSTTEEMYDHMEEAVSLEENFEEQQDTIAKLEQQEKEIYNQIINLGTSEFDKIKELSKKALDLIDQRAEKLKLEKESITAAKEEFTKIEPLIEDIEEKAIKEKGNQLYTTMSERYSAYKDINKAYTEALKLDKELYEMLQKKELKEEDLKKQIEEINQSYDKVLTANKTFNDKTKQYNQQKQKFYELAGLNVEYETDSTNEEGQNQQNKDKEDKSDK